MPYTFKKLLFIPAIILLAAVSLQAAASAEQTVKSKYFNIYIGQGIDRTELLQKLNAHYFLQLKAAFSDENYKSGTDADDQMARTLDAIYLEISDILDIHMYSFSIDLEIVPGKDALSDELFKYLNKRLDMPSFYFYDRNRIYVSFADMTLGMLSHEIAHAIVSHYFVVPPSVKVQEVLAGYAEYSIRKVTVNASKK